MPTYKNLSHAVKTFYGVTFFPNDVKSVSGYINDSRFMRIPEKPVYRTSAVSGVIEVDKPTITQKQQVVEETKLADETVKEQPISETVVTENASTEPTTSSSTIGVDGKKRTTRPYKKRNTTKSKED